MKPVYDKNGIEVHEFDLLKVFHYIGARRKKHYMYKWVRKHPKYDFLFGLHMDTDDIDSGYPLMGKLEETEIVQSPWQRREDLKKMGWKDASCNYDL